MRRPKDQPSPAKTVPGVVFTLCFGAGVAWFVWSWLQIAGWVQTTEGEAVRKNEMRTYRRMQRIRNAQNEYLANSAGVLGQSQFAEFLAHLWITPDLQGRPVFVNLIPKKIALAMGRNRTLSGYYFIDVHRRYGPENGAEKLDYRRQWAISAVPREMPKSGFSVFLADESGRIYVKHVHSRPAGFPRLPRRDGWTVLSSTSDLKKYQQSLFPR